MTALTHAPQRTDALVRGHGLTQLAAAAWPVGTDDPKPPALAGFIVSSFSPLVAEVAQRCLREHYGKPPAPAERGERTAIVIASRAGDTQTAASVARGVDTAARVAPLLFYQAVPNAVAGYLAARWGLAGPVICLSPCGDALVDTLTDTLAEALAVAALVIADGDADEALLIAAELAIHTDSHTDRIDPHDMAVALLVRRAATSTQPGYQGDRP